MPSLLLTEESYERLTRPYRDNPGRAKALAMVNTAFTAIGYVIYPVLLIVLAVFHDPYLIKSIVVPAFWFIVVTIVRSVVDAPRPYETLAIDPLIHKDTKGKSMPSRHAFSMMMIALTWCGASKIGGIVFVIMALLLAVIRVIGGVHHPRDVIVGIVFALLGGLCLLLLPF